MSVTSSFLGALDATLSAAIEIEYMIQHKETGVDGLCKLVEVLEKQHKDVRNVLFFRHLLEECGDSGFQTVADVQRRMKEVVKALRTIEVFHSGDLPWAREFCLNCNRALLAENWDRFMDRRRFA